MREVPLEIGEPDDIVNRLRSAGATEIAEVVEAATRSYQSIDAETLHAEHNQLLERAYLGAPTAEGGSGFGGTPEEWRAGREPITDAIDRDGTFFDVGLRERTAHGVRPRVVRGAGHRCGAVRPRHRSRSRRTRPRATPAMGGSHLAR